MIYLMDGYLMNEVIFNLSSSHHLFIENLWTDDVPSSELFIYSTMNNYMKIKNPLTIHDLSHGWLSFLT